jgi:5'-nucleotidase
MALFAQFCIGKKMRILITNDDGIDGAGLDVLQQIAAGLSDDVWVVAPETEQSGKAHSVTLHEPMRLRSISERVFAVKGTPTDCVIMGVRHILADKRPDLVLSGINYGANIADDVTYSGTIAGAIEGTLLEIPSIALSLFIDYEKHGYARWETPLQHGAALLRKLLAAGWPADTLLNINFPDVEPGEVKGVEVTTQGRRNHDKNGIMIVDREDGMGRPYYWFTFNNDHHPELKKGTDMWAMSEGLISVTPLHLDLTHQEARQQLALALQAG